MCSIVHIYSYCRLIPGTMMMFNTIPDIEETVYSKTNALLSMSKLNMLPKLNDNIIVSKEIFPPETHHM